MKALTIHQPWAWLIAAGHKDIENRVWPAPCSLIGSTIVIHAGLTRDEFGYSTARNILLSTGTFGMPEPEELAYGAAIGTARIIGCVCESESPWFFGPCGFVLVDQRLWAKPVPVRGAQKFWNFPDNLLPEEARQFSINGAIR